MGVTP
jgi:hypothetical protein